MYFSKWCPERNKAENDVYWWAHVYFKHCMSILNYSLEMLQNIAIGCLKLTSVETLITIVFEKVCQWINVRLSLLYCFSWNKLINYFTTVNIPCTSILKINQKHFLVNKNLRHYFVFSEGDQSTARTTSTQGKKLYSSQSDFTLHCILSL